MEEMRRSSKKKQPAARTREAEKDESAVVKAAAWAWYEHGSRGGSQSKKPILPTREYDVACRMSHHAATTSRYKLEAMAKQGEGPNSVHRNMGSRDDGGRSGLLDTYEVESISRELDGLIQSTTSSSTSGHMMMMMTTKKKQKQKNKKNKWTSGIWLRHAVVCGTSREDVLAVETRALGDGLLRRPQNRLVPIVSIANCRRPRASYASY